MECRGDVELDATVLAEQLNVGRQGRGGRTILTIPRSGKSSPEDDGAIWGDEKPRKAGLVGSGHILLLWTVFVM